MRAYVRACVRACMLAFACTVVDLFNILTNINILKNKHKG